MHSANTCYFCSMYMWISEQYYLEEGCRRSQLTLDFIELMESFQSSPLQALLSFWAFRTSGSPGVLFSLKHLENSSFSSSLVHLWRKPACLFFVFCWVSAPEPWTKPKCQWDIITQLQLKYKTNCGIDKKNYTRNSDNKLFPLVLGLCEILLWQC